MFSQRCNWPYLLIVMLLLLAGCASVPQATVESTPTSTIMPTVTATVVPDDVPMADVIAVTVSGAAKAYQFSVEVRSPDEGCDQYADWW